MNFVYQNCAENLPSSRLRRFPVHKTLSKTNRLFHVFEDNRHRNDAFQHLVDRRMNNPETEKGPI